MVAHFEIHATNVEAAKAFYGGLFGWTFSPMPGGEPVEYQLIEGTHFVSGLSGAMMRRMGDTPALGSPIRGGTMSFDVADCDERYAWALANGGSEAMPPADYPNVGRAAYVEDGQGNIVGMVTPIGMEA